MWITAQVVGGAVGGFAGGLIGSEGNISAALKGAITGAMFAGVDGHYGETWNAERVVAKGVAGGISSRLQGGKFADGFWSSSVGAGFRYVYNSVVKYDVTPEAGGEAVDKKALDMPKPNVNNIGTAGDSKGSASE